MKIQIDVRWPRWLQSRRRRFAVTAALTLVLLGVPSALAIHDFTDVPNASPFHSAISAVKAAGITAGKTCVPPGTPPTYCPTEDITREAMAAFVQRGMGRIEQDTDTDSTNLPEVGTVVELLQGDMIVGGVSGTQYVLVHGWYSVDTTGTIGGSCEFRSQIHMDEGLPTSAVSDAQFTEVEANDGDIDTTIHITYAFIAASGVHNFAIKANIFNPTDCTTTSVAGYEVDESGIIITTYPFNQDANGTIFLGPEKGAPTSGGSVEGK